MKQCSRCKKKKPIEEFNFKIKAIGLRQLQCKECTRLLIKNHYNRNRGYYLEKVQKRNKLLRQEVLSYIEKYLLNNPCIDCGETNPVVLEFDHKGEIPKFRAVSSLIRARFPLEKVKKEVEKCNVRCANCHRKKTARDFNWSKNKEEGIIN
jgi:hypothetical protein